MLKTCHTSVPVYLFTRRINARYVLLIYWKTS